MKEPICDICDRPFSKCEKREWHAHQMRVNAAAKVRTTAAEKQADKALKPEEQREDYTNSQAHRKRNEWHF